MLLSLRAQALALKRQGVAVDAAGKQVSAALKKLHPDWPDTDASGFVSSVFNDPADPR
jgi:hypothetical protein